MGQPSNTQPTEKKARLLRLIRKPAAEIQPEVREEMVSDLMENPDPESVTRKHGLALIQVVFSILWVLACKVDRIERLQARDRRVRDGFGKPKVESIAETVRRQYQEAEAA
jgi:hypothetical protein